MSGINIVRNLQILYFSKKNKEIKKLKKWRKEVSWSRQLYILLLFVASISIKVQVRNLNPRNV